MSGRSEGTPDNIAYLVGHHLDRISAVVTNPGDDSPRLDAESLYLEALLGPITSRDAKFKDEWRTIHAEGYAEAARKAREAGFESPDPETWLLERRFAEIRLLVEVAYRNNVLKQRDVPFDDSGWDES